MKTLQELQTIREQALKKLNVRKDSQDIRVVIGMATCGIAAGARPVLSQFLTEIANHNLENVSVEQVGCIGLCRYEPLVEIYEADRKTTYIELSPAKVKRIVSSHLVNHQVVSEYTIGAAHDATTSC